MYHGHSQPLSDGRITSGLSNPIPDSRIVVHLHYRDHQQDVKISNCCVLPTRDTIHDVIYRYLWTADLRDINPNDVSLAELVYGSERSSPPPWNKHKTLSELKIKDGHTLYFKRSTTIVPPTTSSLSIIGPNTSSSIAIQMG